MNLSDLLKSAGMKIEGNWDIAASNTLPAGAKANSIYKAISFGSLNDVTLVNGDLAIVLQVSPPLIGNLTKNPTLLTVPTFTTLDPTQTLTGQIGRAHV